MATQKVMKRSKDGTLTEVTGKLADKARKAASSGEKSFRGGMGKKYKVVSAGGTKKSSSKSSSSKSSSTSTETKRPRARPSSGGPTTRPNNGKGSMTTSSRPKARPDATESTKPTYGKTSGRGTQRYKAKSKKSDAITVPNKNVSTRYKAKANN